MSGDDYAGARDAAAWVMHTRSAWPGVQVTHVESSGVADAPELGQPLEVRAVVELGDVSPDDVDVQLAYGPVNENDELTDPTYAQMQRADQIDGAWRYEASVTLQRRGAFGYTVRVLPRHRTLSAPADLDLVALPHETTAYTAV